MSKATTATPQEKIVEGSLAPATEQEAFISWEDFQKDYLSREDEYKYEWLAGTIEKTPRSMERTQLYILLNLQDYFYRLKFASKVHGALLAEGDLFFEENHRRPDICWLTDKQVKSLAKNNKDVPAFVIEIISTNDMINRVAVKMEDYRAAKVQVVWHIFPNLKQVHVYTGQKLESMQVCKDDDICSAKPALAAFEISVAEIFKVSV